MAATASFIGLQFKHGGLSTEARLEPLPGIVHTDGTWHGTRRQLAHMLGTVLWFLRVTGHLLCHPRLEPFWALMQANAVDPRSPHQRDSSSAEYISRS